MNKYGALRANVMKFTVTGVIDASWMQANYVCAVLADTASTSERIPLPPPKIGKFRKRFADFTYYLFTLNFSLFTNLVDFWK